MLKLVAVLIVAFIAIIVSLSYINCDCENGGNSFPGWPEATWPWEWVGDMFWVGIFYAGLFVASGCLAGLLLLSFTSGDDEEKINIKRTKPPPMYPQQPMYQPQQMYPPLNPQNPPNPQNQ